MKIPFRSLLASVSLAFLLLSPRFLSAQAFDCVILNDDNTNIFLTPDECFFPENLVWCNCVRSLFPHPVKAEKSGFNQAVEWIVKQPGIGNHRVEVKSGTLDLSSLHVDDVIGETLINELIPQSVGVPPGTFFVVKTQVKVTAVSGNSADLSINIIEVSRPWVPRVLRYDPMDATHSNGHLYDGRLTSRGPGNGFVWEYRYPKEEIVADPENHPAIQTKDADAPGFTVRFLFKIFTTESGIYTLPNTSTVAVSTALRRFTENTLDEILDLGADDLCQALNDPTPCKLIDETLQLKSTLSENSPPTAAITMIDPNNASLIPNPADIEKMCGEARIIFRGSNSDDGDGGVQKLSYEWSVISGPAGGASIPEATKTFMDTEITFIAPGVYEIGLRVTDDGTGTNSDQASVNVTVRDDLDFNVPPAAVIVTDPDPPAVELVDGAAAVKLDGSQSSNGTPGLDDCKQTLTFHWTQTRGPAEGTSTITSPGDAVTQVSFSFPGDYTFELEVDDGAPVDNVATAEVSVAITGLPPQTRFRRGDSDADGQVNITDAIRTLNFLFSGTQTVPCLDAADSDDSGEVNITDPIKVLNFLFSGGANPAPPGPFSCGSDPTLLDGLAECTYRSC